MDLKEDQDIKQQKQDLSKNYISVQQIINQQNTQLNNQSEKSNNSQIIQQISPLSPKEKQQLQNQIQLQNLQQQIQMHQPHSVIKSPSPMNVKINFEHRSKKNQREVIDFSQKIKVKTKKELREESQQLKKNILFSLVEPKQEREEIKRLMMKIHHSIISNKNKASKHIQIYGSLKTNGQTFSQQNQNQQQQTQNSVQTRSIKINQTQVSQQNPQAIQGPTIEELFPNLAEQKQKKNISQYNMSAYQGYQKQQQQNHSQIEKSTNTLNGNSSVNVKEKSFYFKANESNSLFEQAKPANNSILNSQSYYNQFEITTHQLYGKNQQMPSHSVGNSPRKEDFRYQKNKKNEQNEEILNQANQNTYNSYNINIKTQFPTENNQNNSNINNQFNNQFGTTNKKRFNFSMVKFGQISNHSKDPLHNFIQIQQYNNPTNLKIESVSYENNKIKSSTHRNDQNSSNHNNQQNQDNNKSITFQQIMKQKKFQKLITAQTETQIPDNYENQQIQEHYNPEINNHEYNKDNYEINSNDILLATQSDFSELRNYYGDKYENNKKNHFHSNKKQIVINHQTPQSIFIPHNSSYYNEKYHKKNLAKSHLLENNNYFNNLKNKNSQIYTENIEPWDSEENQFEKNSVQMILD